MSNHCGFEREMEIKRGDSRNPEMSVNLFFPTGAANFTPRVL